MDTEGVRSISEELLRVLASGSNFAMLTAVLSMFAVLSSVATTVISLYGARRAAEAKEAVRLAALHDARLRTEFVKALRDGHLDERESKIIIRYLTVALENELASKKSSNADHARRFVRDLHPYKSRRILEELGKEVTSSKIPA